MTSKQAQKFLDETQSKKLVTAVVNHFNGENYTVIKKFLSVLTFYLTENAFLDSELAKSHIEYEGDDEN